MGGGGGNSLVRGVDWYSDCGLTDLAIRDVFRYEEVATVERKTKGWRNRRCGSLVEECAVRQWLGVGQCGDGRGWR